MMRIIAATWSSSGRPTSTGRKSGYKNWRRKTAAVAGAAKKRKTAAVAGAGEPSKKKNKAATPLQRLLEEHPELAS